MIPGQSDFQALPVPPGPRSCLGPSREGCRLLGASPCCSLSACLHPWWMRRPGRQAASPGPSVLLLFSELRCRRWSSTLRPHLVQNNSARPRKSHSFYLLVLFYPLSSLFSSLPHMFEVNPFMYVLSKQLLFCVRTFLVYVVLSCSRPHSASCF